MKINVVNANILKTAESNAKTWRRIENIYGPFLTQNISIHPDLRHHLQFIISDLIFQPQSQSFYVQLKFRQIVPIRNIAENMNSSVSETESEIVE